MRGFVPFRVFQEQPPKVPGVFVPPMLALICPLIPENKPVFVGQFTDQVNFSGI